MTLDEFESKLGCTLDCVTGPNPCESCQQYQVRIEPGQIWLWKSDKNKRLEVISVHNKKSLVLVIQDGNKGMIQKRRLQKLLTTGLILEEIYKQS